MRSKESFLYPAILVGITSLFLFNILGVGFIVGYLLVPLLYINSEYIKQSLEPGYFMILIFSISYALFYKLTPLSSNQFFIMYAIFPSTLYLTGKYLAEYYKTEKKIFNLLFIFAFIFSLRAIISVLLVFRITGFAMTLEYGRNLPILWEASNITSATLIAMYFTFNMCIPAILVTKSIIKDKLFIVCSCIIFILTMICIMRIGSRTQMVICGLTLLISLFYVLPTQRISKNLKLIGITAFIAMFIAANVSFDLDAEWLSSYAYRLENSGNTLSGGGRTELWLKSLRNMVTKPFGWDRNEFGFSHNMWLDVARVGGTLSILLLLTFTLRAILHIKNAFQVAKNKSFKIQILTYGISFLLAFSGEPILDATVYIFPLFCFFIGVLNGYLNLNQKLKQNQ